MAQLPSHAPSIWLEHPNQQMANVGDLAMLIMDVERTRSLFPESEVLVPSRETDWVSRFCPGATRVTASGLYHLAWRWLLPERLVQSPRLRAVEQQLILRDGYRYLSAIGWRNRLRGQHDPHSGSEMDRLARSRLVVACGGGYLNDAFAGAASRCTKVLLAAQSRGIPTVLMGQGLGPVEQPDGRRLIGPMLSRARLIGLREGLNGPALARSFGVQAGRTVVTGDGAIDLAARERTETLGTCIGFNVRVARYAGISEERLAGVSRVVGQAARNWKATLVPCPIHFGMKSPDEAVARDLLEPGFCVRPDECPFDPVEVVRRVGTCRVVVTGSYHAAVFALSQGIPAIGLVGSRYYGAKFSGLADLFGDAMGVVELEHPDALDALSACLEQLWRQAPDLRWPCRAAADHQRELTRAAWARLPEIARGRSEVNPN